MDLDDILDKEYEKLNDAILQAIVASEEVKDVLERFKNKYHMNDKAVLNLFLSLEELYQMTSEEPSGSSNYKLEPSASKQSENEIRRPSSEENNIIDGKVLTINEVLFEDFFQEKCNEFEWMKKARIRF